MRQLGSLPKELDPKVFVDYLLTLGMKTHVDERPDGWSLWIYNEDHLPRAREELTGYLSAPMTRATTAPSIRPRPSVARKKSSTRSSARTSAKPQTSGATPASAAGPSRSCSVSCASPSSSCLETKANRHKVENTLRFSTNSVNAHGDEHNNGIKEITRGEVWRLVTPSFLHFGILHLLLNMMALSALGTLIEIRRGSLRLALMILILSVTSNIGEFLFWEQREPGKAHHLFGGMSGVICGLFGYIWMKGLYEPEQGMALHPNSVSFGLLWIVLCMTGVFGPIANSAHVVGLIVGVALGVLRY